MFTVYMHIFPNNKVYIGITSNKYVKKRWRKGNGYRTQRLMCRAIQKYGWDNIEHIIVAENLTKDEACKMEIDLIAEYRSNDSRYGYNIYAGGDCGRLGIPLSDKEKARLREFNRSRSFTEATIQQIKSSVAKYWTKERRDEWSRRFSGDNSPAHILELQDVVEIYNELCDGVSRRRVSAKHNISISVVDRIANKRHWAIETNPEYFTRKLPDIYLYQYTLNDIYIRRWNRMLDAVDSLGVNYGSISSCCKGKLKKAGGYKWKWIAVLDTGEEVDYDI